MGLFSEIANSLHNHADKIRETENSVDEMSIEELAFKIERSNCASEYYTSMRKKLIRSSYNVSVLVDYLKNNGYECKKCTNRFYKIFQDAGYFCKQDRNGVYHLDSGNIW